MGTAAWEREQDRQYHRMMAAGEAADRALAEREYASQVKTLRRHAEAAQASGLRYFRLYEGCWMIFEIVGPIDLDQPDTIGAAGLVERARITYWAGPHWAPTFPDYKYRFELRAEGPATAFALPPYISYACDTLEAAVEAAFAA